MKDIRQLLIAWMFVAFLMLQGFGQSKMKVGDGVLMLMDPYRWSDFTYHSAEEKAFWDKLPNWTIRECPPPELRRNSQGDYIDNNSNEGFTGYAKAMRRARGLSSFPEQPIRSIYQFVDGYLIRAKTWYKNGQVFCESNYKEGISYVWTHFNQKNIPLEIRSTVRHHENALLSHDFYPTQVDAFNLNDGMFETLMTYRYANGQKNNESNFKDGLLVSSKSWKPNGEKCPVTNVTNGNGIIVAYDEDGTEMKRTTFKNGKKSKTNPPQAQTPQYPPPANLRLLERLPLITVQHPDPTPQTSGSDQP